MKKLIIFEDKKNAGTMYAQTGEVEGKVVLMLADGSEQTPKKISPNTLKRWYKNTGETMSEADFLTKLTGKKVTPKQLDRDAEKVEAKPEPEVKKETKVKESKPKATKPTKVDDGVFKLKKELRDVVQEIADTTEGAEIIQKYGVDVLVVNGIKKFVYGASMVIVRKRDAEAQNHFKFAVHKYGMPFMAKLDLTYITSRNQLMKELTKLTK